MDVGVPTLKHIRVYHICNPSFFFQFVLYVFCDHDIISPSEFLIQSYSLQIDLILYVH